MVFSPNVLHIPHSTFSCFPPQTQVPEVSGVMHDVLRGGLFPAKLSPASAARHWAAGWAAADAKERTGTLCLLRSSAALRMGAAEMLAQRPTREQRATGAAKDGAGMQVRADESYMRESSNCLPNT